MLKGKVALVTGASRGVGAGIAELFTQQGAFVYVNYLNSQEKADALVEKIKNQGGKAKAVCADVTVKEDVQNMIQTVEQEQGRLDILVNNALPKYEFNPAAPYTQLETLEWEHFQSQIEGAIRGTFHTAKIAFPIMKAQGGGKVINISTNLVYNRCAKLIQI